MSVLSVKIITLTTSCQGKKQLLTLVSWITIVNQLKLHNLTLLAKSSLTTSSKAQNIHQYQVIIPLKELIQVETNLYLVYLSITQYFSLSMLLPNAFLQTQQLNYHHVIQDFSTRVNPKYVNAIIPVKLCIVLAVDQLSKEATDLVV